jgi:hypothetical protein
VETVLETSRTGVYLAMHPRHGWAHKIAKAVEYLSMIPEATRNRPARSWIALFALAALAILAPGAAEAGCHGRVASTGSATLSNLDEFINGGATGTVAMPDVPIEAPSPCTGAFCSGSPATPSPSTSVPVVTPGSWAILVQRRDHQDPGSKPHVSPEPLRPPSHLSVEVFHPPRTVVAGTR